MSNFKDLKDVFEFYLKDIKVDAVLYDKIKRYRLAWAQKDSIYIEFLGGNLTGVHPIRFSTLDEDKFFIDILNIDQSNLKYDLHKLAGIDKSRNVTSNPMYLTLFYLIHRYASLYPKEKYAVDAIKEVYYIFAYKVISSLISHYFSYNLDLATAKATYERLTNRFLIKKYGSWQKVFEHRAQDVLPPNGLHFKRAIDGTTDDGVRTIADMQGRIRENIKNIYVVLMEVIQSNEKIFSTTLIEEDEDGGTTKDVADRPDKYIMYIRGIVNKPNDFIVDDLVYLTHNLIKNLPVDKFVETLKYISEKLVIKPSSADDFIEISIDTTINYMTSKGITHDYANRILDVMMNMKGYWSSSSVKDSKVIHVKKYVSNIVSEATGLKTNWQIASISIAVLIYVFLRAVYSKK